MNINKIGLRIVYAFSAWCIYRGLSEPAAWSSYIVPATVVVLVGGVFAFNLGRDERSHDD